MPTTCKHSWSLWEPYDPHVIEMGLTQAFRYGRMCTKSGCTARERADDVFPRGRVEASEADPPVHWKAIGPI